MKLNVNSDSWQNKKWTAQLRNRSYPAAAKMQFSFDVVSSKVIRRGQFFFFHCLHSKPCAHATEIKANKTNLFFWKASKLCTSEMFIVLKSVLFIFSCIFLGCSLCICLYYNDLLHRFVTHFFSICIVITNLFL